jgi:hypothetical protein
MSQETKMPDEAPLMLGVATVVTRRFNNEESKILVTGGSKEEIEDYIQSCGHLGTSAPVWVKFLIGPRVDPPKEEPSNIILPFQSN